MKILVLTSILPYPKNRGDKTRLAYVIEHLSEFAEVRVVSVDRTWEGIPPQDAIPDLPSVAVVRYPVGKNKVVARAAKNFLSLKPFKVFWFASKGFIKFVQKEVNEFDPDVIWSFQVDMNPVVERIQTKAKKIIDLLDPLSAQSVTIRQAKDTSRTAKIVANTQLNLDRYERKALLNNDYIYVSSPTNFLYIRDTYPQEFEKVRDRIDSLSPCVPDIYFHTTWQPNNRIEILFVGNLSYAPNEVAIEYAIAEVMPLVWQKMPDAIFKVCGMNEGKLARKYSYLPKVEFTGFVEDLAAVYSQATVNFVPVPYAAGIQNKLLEAMAVGLPSILSSNALAANGVRADIEVFSGNTPATLADSILAAIEDRDRAAQIAANARQYVEKHHSRLGQYHQVKDAVELICAKN
jgi:polysaccharide biosynthesis protein PslH